MIVPIAYALGGMALLVVGFVADIWILRVIAGAYFGAGALPLIIILCRNYWRYGVDDRAPVNNEARIVMYNPSYIHDRAGLVAVISNTDRHIQQIARTL